MYLQRGGGWFDPMRIDGSIARAVPDIQAGFCPQTELLQAKSVHRAAAACAAVDFCPLRANAVRAAGHAPGQSDHDDALLLFGLPPA